MLVASHCGEGIHCDHAPSEEHQDVLRTWLWDLTFPFIEFIIVTDSCITSQVSKQLVLNTPPGWTITLSCVYLLQLVSKVTGLLVMFAYIRSQLSSLIPPPPPLSMSMSCALFSSLLWTFSSFPASTPLSPTQAHMCSRSQDLHM